MHSRPANTESPRWYIKKRRYVEAYTSLKRLRLHEIQAARDLYYITAQIEAEAELIGNTNHVRRFGELFSIPRIRRATSASFLVMIGQQMCGINIIVSVAIMALSLPASYPNNLDKKPGGEPCRPTRDGNYPDTVYIKPRTVSAYRRISIDLRLLFVGVFSRQVYQPRHRCPLAGL